MNDLGVERSWSEPVSTEGKSTKKKEKHYPRESFTTDQMPGLKGATMGQKVKMVIEAEVVEVSQGEEYPYPGENEDEQKKKIRVAVKMLKGSASLQGQMTQQDNKTFQEKEEDKVDEFSKTIGIDDQEEGE